MAVLHVTECERARELLEDFRRAWPLACTGCGAWGSVTYYEDVVGDGGPMMQMSEECARCVGEAICGRCASSDISINGDEGWGTCQACGWTDDPDRHTDAMHAPDWECLCPAMGAVS
jgi:hypothetical protein